MIENLQLHLTREQRARCAIYRLVAQARYHYCLDLATARRWAFARYLYDHGRLVG
jgi:hypothetical protein